MLTTLVTAPAEEPVNMTEVKEFLRVDETADDAQILAMVKAATRRVEAFIDRKLITQTWAIYWDQFPATTRNVWWDGVRDVSISELVSPKRALEFPFGPMISLDSFSTFSDYSEDPIPYDLTNFTLDLAGPTGRIALKMGSSWPTTILRGVNGIKAVATFGYGDANMVPSDIKLAIKMFVGKMYEHRGDDEMEAVSKTMPQTAAMLLEPFRHVKAC